MTSSLRAISPIDGRYKSKTAPLRAYLSEWALMKYRLRVELAWLAALADDKGVSHVRPLTQSERDLLQKVAADFDAAAAERIKAIEAETKHDVKAVEYYLRERLNDTSLSDLTPSAHFACTSADINNLAYALMFRDAMRKVWQPAATAIIKQLQSLTRVSSGAAMLARTHGQPATPTTLGKELAVFASRLRRQLNAIESQDYLGKFNGAVGAYNAHLAAYPAVDWLDLSRTFVESLGLSFNALTTQIEPHDHLAELAHSLLRFNSILLDLCRDIWTYISLGYFRQRAAADEVGSSTMPHKINPIDFENAEANLGISSSSFAHLAGKLPVSRLQRDLSDSSAMRNYGVAIAHSFIALLSVQSGLAKLDIDHAALAADLDKNWQVLAEAVQTVLRKHQFADAYEQLKDLTRGAEITREALHDFIRQLDIPADEMERLLRLTPATYLGLAQKLALSVVDDLSSDS